jgi:GLPGLI family protein
MYRKLIYCFILLFLSTGLVAQTKFITAGKIEFERKTNQHALLTGNNVWSEMAKKNSPKFVTLYYDLYFKEGRSLYKTGREPEIRQNKVFPDADNIVAANLDSGTIVTQKTLFSEIFLISDTLRKIDWKIASEIRKIAGFDCRKAVGRVLDSIVVIAFYTDEIVPSGGPESFTGLPGMILGLAIPRMHTTWYATKLELLDVPEKELVAPKRGKKYNGPGYRADISNVMKNWGEEAKQFQWQLML